METTKSVRDITMIKHSCCLCLSIEVKMCFSNSFYSKIESLQNANLVYASMVHFIFKLNGINIESCEDQMSLKVLTYIWKP